MNINLENTTERIMEIIAKVIEGAKSSANLMEINVQSLKSAGYSDAEISIAISWLLQYSGVSEKRSNDDTSIPFETKYRILTAEEMSLFTKEALSELMQYVQFGLLKNEHLELLLERGFISGEHPTMDVKTLRTVVREFLFREKSPQHSRAMLHHSDTVH